MNVSHVITTKGRAGFLRTALAHAVYMKMPGSELIVTDGAESPEVARVVEQAGNVDIFISEKDDSNCTGHNRGIEAATNDIIHPMADDDWFHQPAISQAAKILSEHDDIGILFCGGYKVGALKGKVWHDFAPKCIPLGTNYGKSCQDVFDWGASGAGFIFTKKTWEAVGGFDPKYAAADMDFMLKCIDKGLGAKFLRVNMFTHPIYPHSFLSMKREQIHMELRAWIEQYGCQTREAPMEWQVPPEWDGEFA